MATSTSALSMADAKIEITLDHTAGTPTWVDICADIAEITVSGGDRQTSETNTFCSAGAPIVMLGNKAPFDIELQIVYTEGASDAWQLLYTAHATIAAAAIVGVRWSPKGGDTGEFRFTASGMLLDCPPPSGSAGDSTPIIVTAKFRSATIVQSTIAP